MLEGWKLVPIEPTEAMLKAGEGICAACCQEGDQTPAIWEAMLAAAPDYVEGKSK